MIHYLKKIIILLFAVLLFYLFPVVVLYLSGELTPLDKACERVEKEDVLLGLAYSGENNNYKYIEAGRLQPDILMLGTSRIMEISSKWFSEEYSFYNAGGGIVEPIDAITFLESIDKKPQLLVLNIDQFSFNENASFRFNASYYYEYNPIKIIRKKSWFVYIDYLKGKFRLSDLRQNHIGLNACANQNGFQKDGFYYYGSVIKHPELQPDYDFTDCLTRINEGNRRFEYGTDIDPQMLNDMQDIIRYCSDNSIALIAILPPFAPTIQEALNQKGDSYKYMKLIYPTIKEYFDNQTSFVYDFQYDIQLDDNDSEYIDGFHGSNAVYLKLWMKIIESNPIAKQYSKVLPELNPLLESEEYNIKYR